MHCQATIFLAHVRCSTLASIKSPLSSPNSHLHRQKAVLCVREGGLTAYLLRYALSNWRLCLVAYKEYAPVAQSSFSSPNLHLHRQNIIVCSLIQSSLFASYSYLHPQNKEYAPLRNTRSPCLARINVPKEETENSHLHGERVAPMQLILN